MNDQIYLGLLDHVILSFSRVIPNGRGEPAAKVSALRNGLVQSIHLDGHFGSHGPSFLANR
jgi:hypothetical protein